MKMIIGTLALLALATQAALAGAGNVPDDLRNKILGAVEGTAFQAFRHQECGLTEENKEAMSDKNVDEKTLRHNYSAGLTGLAAGALLGGLGGYSFYDAFMAGEVSIRDGEGSTLTEGTSLGTFMGLSMVAGSAYGSWRLASAKDNDTSPLGREFLMNDGKIDRYASEAAKTLAAILNLDAAREASLRSAIKKDAFRRIRKKVREEDEEQPDLYAVVKSATHNGKKLLDGKDAEAFEYMKIAFGEQVEKLRKEGRSATAYPSNYGVDEGIEYLRKANAGLEKCAGAKDDENVQDVIAKNKAMIRLWTQFKTYAETGRAGDEGPKSQEREVSPVE